MRLLLLLLLCAPGPACIGPRPAGVQGMLGVGVYDTRYMPPDVSEGELPFENPFLMGAAIQQPLNRESARLDLGLELGGTVGFDNQHVSAVSGSGGAVVVIDSEIVSADAFGGGYASLDLGSRARLYVGAGPLIQFSWARLEQQELGGSTSSHDSAMGFGAYARTGLEFRVPDGSIGLTLRWLRADLDFDDLPGNDLEGFQVLLSYTRVLGANPGLRGYDVP